MNTQKILQKILRPKKNGETQTLNQLVLRQGIGPLLGEEKIQSG